MNLPSLQTIDGRYCLVSQEASEHQAQLLGLDLGESSNQVTLNEVMGEALRVAAPIASGLVVDARFGFDGLAEDERPAKLGLGLRVFQHQDASNWMMPPQLLPNWGLEEVANNYAAAYLKMYYHPSLEKALEKKQIIGELYDYCQYLKIGMILDIRLIGHHGGLLDHQDREETAVVAVQELQKWADLVVLEYPGSALAAATVTAELDSPWIVSPAPSSEYDVFKENLRAALEAGAAGALLDSNLWPEISQLRLEDTTPDRLAISTYWQTTYRDRLLELARIIDEATIPLS
jgi:tagatose-1,6-bisphosphate aldolase